MIIVKVPYGTTYHYKPLKETCFIDTTAKICRTYGTLVPLFNILLQIFSTYRYFQPLIRIINGLLLVVRYIIKFEPLITNH